MKGKSSDIRQSRRLAGEVAERAQVGVVETIHPLFPLLVLDDTEPSFTDSSRVHRMVREGRSSDREGREGVDSLVQACSAL